MRPLCAEVSGLTDDLFPNRKCPTTGLPRVGHFFRHPVHIQLSKDVVTLFTLQLIPDNGSLLTNVQFRQAGSDIAEYVFSSNRCCVFLQEVPNFPDSQEWKFFLRHPVQLSWHIRRAILMEKHLYSCFLLHSLQQFFNREPAQ